MSFLPRVITSRPDLRLSLGLNRKFEIGSVYVSNVTSISYANTQEQYDSQRQLYAYDYAKESKAAPDTRTQPILNQSYTDTRSLSAVRLGVIHNYQVRLNDRNRVEFRNFFNQYGTDEVVHRRFADFPNELERNDYILHYQSRSIYSGQLGGNHEVGPARRTSLTWAAGYNYVNRNEPDYRINQQQRLLVPGKLGDANPDPFEVVLNQGVSNTDTRFFSTLKENTYMASGQVERRLANQRDTLSANQVKLRLGFYVEEKKRNYNSRFFNYVPAGSRFDGSIRSQPLATIFSPANLDPVTGLTLREGTLPQDRYLGTNRLVAGYLSAVLPLSDKFNISGGVRLEYNRKYVRSGLDEVDTTRTPYLESRTFVLPSFNATYNFNERSLLRAASSISVNRPEFREVVEQSYYDVNTNLFITGNKDLVTARIYNADLRYEFYPTRSELISVGVFYKYFTNAIEQLTTSVSSGGLFLGYQNAKKAYDVGAELEVRKSLVGLTESAFLQRFSLVANASLIHSRVELEEVAANKDFALPPRPLQGQAPYVVNLGLFYQDTDNKWQVSGQYNVVGPRITFVGDLFQNPSIIELPRHVVDLAVTKGIGEHVDVRAGVQNLLNQAVRQYYDFDRNGSINGSENGKAFAEYKRGVYSTLGVTYHF